MDEHVAEGFGPVTVGQILTCRQVRRVLLGPFVGSDLVDMHQEVEELHEQLRLELEANGIGTARTYGRAEWLGVFDYEVEVHLEVVLFWPAKGKSVEEVQASVMHVFGAIVVLVGLAITARIVSDVRGVSDNVVTASTPFTVFGVALGLLALAFIVYQINKAPSIGAAHG